MLEEADQGQSTWTTMPDLTQQQPPPPAYTPPASAHGGDWVRLTPGSIDQVQVERVRRFLLFCLAVDYNLVTASKGWLNGEEWSYFMRLARLAMKEGIVARKNGGIVEEDLKADSESQTVQREFHMPVYELGVPLSMARSLLILFPRRVRANGEHGSVLKRNNAHTMPELATRLLTDREIVFDALMDGVNNARLRKDLEEANRKLEKQFFTKLDSPDDYTLTQHGETLDGYFRFDPSERQMAVIHGETGVKNKLTGFIGQRKQAGK